MNPVLCDLLEGAPTNDVLVLLDYLYARRRVRAIMNEDSALALPTKSDNAKALKRSEDR